RSPQASFRPARGVGPFFRVEPLGLEYVAATLVAHGHEPVIADLRFGTFAANLPASKCPDRRTLEFGIVHSGSRIFLSNGSHRGSLFRFFRSGASFIQVSSRSRLA